MLIQYVKMYLGAKLMSEANRRVAEGHGDKYMGITVYDKDGNGSEDTKKFTDICNDFINNDIPFYFESCNKLYLVAHGLQDGNIYDGNGYKVDKDCILNMIGNKDLLAKYDTVQLISCYNGLKKDYEVASKKIVIPEWSKANAKVKLSFFAVTSPDHKTSLMLNAIVADFKYSIIARLVKRVLFKSA